MVRRTKLAAMATREAILDGAELLFRERGVSRTSLQDIATASHMTRGAIYWHFKDKGDLFNAMMERATEPLDEQLRHDPASKSADPIAYVRALVLKPLEMAATLPRVQSAFDIAMHKVEYVDELIVGRDRGMAMYDRCLMRAEQGMTTAIEQGLLASPMSPRDCARGLWALIDGLIRSWLLNAQAFDLLAVGEQAVDAYLNGLRPVKTRRGLAASGTALPAAPLRAAATRRGHPRSPP